MIHIDQLNWQPGWVESTKPELQRKLANATSDERWVIDGNYGGTMAQRLERADTVVYLDFPIPLCLWRLVRRWWTYRKTARPDMTEGCPERIDFAFLWYVAWWRSGPGPRTEARLKAYRGTVVRLHGPRELERWLAALPG